MDEVGRRVVEDDDLREAADRHPVASLVTQIEDLLPNVRLPLQWPPGHKVVGAN